MPRMPLKTLLLLTLTLYGVGLPRHLHMVTEHGQKAQTSCVKHVCHATPSENTNDQPAPDRTAPDDCSDCQMLAGTLAIPVHSPMVSGQTEPIAVPCVVTAQAATRSDRNSTLGPRGPPTRA